MEFFPLFIKLRDLPVVIAGGGAVAARKVRVLQHTGAHIKVVAPKVRDDIRLLTKHRTLSWVEREFQDRDIEGAALVIAATRSRGINRHIVELCQGKDIHVNSVDGDDGDVIFPALIRRDPLQVAVSTQGCSPALSRLLRGYLSGCLPDRYAQMARLSGRYRERAAQVFPDVGARRRFWDTVVKGSVASMLFAGREQAAERELLRLLKHPADLDRETGEVYLVGAGPGDPDLLTFKALRLMQQADIVVYDRLVSREIMELLPADAEKIYVGKERSRHTLPQEGINELLVRHARAGLRVLRFKGGDPFIFGRGGEEIETLLEEHIPFQIVPGITAASGCAAYAGIPLTHRDFAHTCVFSTGHLRDGEVDLDWKMLTRPRQTLVFYMGLQGLERICAQLISHGLPTSTPAALITRGTMPVQKVLVGRLDNLVRLVEDSEIKPPSLLIIGQVVQLHDKLHWYYGDDT